MAFKDAIKFLSDYRDKRGDALNNQKRMAWSTQPVDTLDDFIAVFSSAEENANWENMYLNDKEFDSVQLEGARLKIAFLAGHRRDMRILFACSENNRVRSGLDHDRFEYMQSSFNRQKLEVLEQVIDSKDKGLGKTI